MKTLKPKEKKINKGLSVFPIFPWFLEICSLFVFFFLEKISKDKTKKRKTKILSKNKKIKTFFSKEKNDLKNKTNNY